jgi:serine/threonine-protein kinase
MFDRYRVKRLVHEGGMGEVYLVDDMHRPGEQFAVKMLKGGLPPQVTDRFRQEARVLESLRHPGIVRIYSLFEFRGRLCCVLAYIEGESLADRIDRDGALPVAQALPLFTGVLVALDYAHRCGVIHRDVKPSNILLDRDGTPRLCDFGIARRFGPNRLTRAGTTMGTPQYMSPEQIQTPLQIDYRSDLYSAGIVLYEMLTGRVPFGADSSTTDLDILAQQVERSPPNPRVFNDRLDGRIADILRKALSKNPDLRFQGGLEFKRALEAYQQEPAGNRLPTVPGSQYAVYEHPTLHRRIAIKSGVAWPALIQGPVWLAAHDLRGRAVGVLVVSIAFGAGAQGPLGSVMLVGMAATWGLAPALLGPKWRAHRCERLGYVLKGRVRASTAEQAVGSR